MAIATAEIAIAKDRSSPNANRRRVINVLSDNGSKLNAELVVLSACDTGRGKLSGDGVIGLSRSLIAAGTPSTIQIL